MLPEMRKVPLMESQARMSVSHSMDFSSCEPEPSCEPSYMSEERPETDIMFSASIEALKIKTQDAKTHTSPRKQQAKFGVKSLINRLVGARSDKNTSAPKSSEERLRQAFSSQSENVSNVYLVLAVTIDWDKCSNNFLINETTDLARAEQKIVQSLAESLFVIELAVELNVARTVIALALLAKLVEDNDRSARRFAYVASCIRRQ
jgi:hypothetical protein